jgi:AraC-like DNA-binding protein
MQTVTNSYSQGILQYAEEIKLIESLNADMISQLVGQNVPFRSDGIAILIVRKGSLSIELDYNSYSIEKNDLFVKLPEHIMQKIEADGNFEGTAIMIKRQLLEETVALLNRVLYNPNYMRIRLHPRCKLSDNEVKAMLDAMSLVKEKICLQGNNFQHDIIKCAILMMLLECENSILKYNQQQSIKLKRQEQILNQFLELLKGNCKKEHKVEFYTDKLFVTPQYLSLVLRNISGKTAYQWIVEGITTEAKILLKDAALNVQQIADILNFPDPSSFGKFFKKQTGLSPFKYRNQNSENQKLF